MTVQTLTLPYHPTDQNTYINAERSNRFMAAKIKKEETEKVYWHCKEQGLKPIDGQVQISFLWTVKNKRKDPDNIAFTKKFILDGMVKAGVLQNDNLTVITEMSDKFLFSDHEEVDILITQI